jgi:hypothetical protein
MYKALILLSILVGSSACGASPDSVGELPDDDLRDGDGPSKDDDAASLGTCDAAGVFAVRMVSYSRFLVDAVTSTWFYVEIEQDGDALRVLDSVDCGYGSAGGGMHAYTSTHGDAALAEHNSQVGRSGVMRKSGARCDFHLERFFSVHGLEAEIYLPDGPFADYDLAHVQALVPLPTKASHSPDIEDWDEDQKPGITVFIGNEARYNVARDWTEWFSCNGTAADSPICSQDDLEKYGLKAGASFDEFTVRSDFEGEETALGATSSLYAGTSMPLRIADNRVTFKRMGRSRDDELPAQFWSKATATDRCDMLRELLPLEEE